MNSIHLRNRKIKNLGFLILSLFALGFNQQVSAQKKPDHITLNDSVYSDGYIKINKSNPLKSVFFKSKRRTDYKNFDIQEVSEFYENHRRYERKTFDFRGETVTVFLEKLVYDNPDISVYKWINENDLFFLESENSISLLGENFREEISRKLDNPTLSPLLEISKLNYNSLSYLLTLANRNLNPQTFSRFFRVIPQLGLSFSSHELAIPNQNSRQIINGSTIDLGLSFEFLPTYKRNISVIISPSFALGHAEGFSSYEEGDSNFDTDLYFNFTTIQAPIAARYYLEIRPNKFRAFIELGYSWYSMKAKDGRMDIAEIKENTFSTDSREFDPSSDYYGFNAGIGGEKYLKKTRAITMGIKYSALRNKNTEEFNQFSPYVGFKF